MTADEAIKQALAIVTSKPLPDDYVEQLYILRADVPEARLAEFDDIFEIGFVAMGDQLAEGLAP